jgi:hypothetical protein
MWVSPKLINFFEQNSDKSKDEVIELLMERFKFKRSTANQRYIDYQNNKGGVNIKELTFKFFEENPHVVDSLERKKYAEELGISVGTYSAYKGQYREKLDQEKHELKMKRLKDNPPVEPKYGEKYYKGRLREFFKFDDSRL